MKKWVVIILTAMFCLVVTYGIVIGVFYFKTNEKSERELWRSTDYIVQQAVATNDQFIFSGRKADRSIDCDCIYATNKLTGKIIWSTEEIEKPYMKEASQLEGNLPPVSSYIEMASPKQDVIFISLMYDWEDTIKSALLAVRSNDGKLLWKVDGEVDSGSFANSVLEKNQIFVFDEQGDLLAINSDTGKEIWRRNVYQYYDSADIWFRYYKDTVFTFNKKTDQKIKAFNAETGQSPWESDRFGSERWNIHVFNKTIYLVSPPLNNNKLVTAIDLETGKKRWDMIFPDVSEFSMAAGSNNEVLFLDKKYEGGYENFHKLAKLIVVDEFTGQSLWKFNENLSHGDLHYHINNSTVFIGTEDGYIFSMDSATGNVILQNETKQFPIPFAVAGNDLIVVYKENYISVLDTKTGLQKWKLDLGVSESWSILGEDILGVNSNTIFVAGNYNQRIYAIDINTGNELWSWSHFLPVWSKYEIELIDNVLYVDQWSDYGWYYFALKTEQ
jgi:outer membrane protein assembly factor BamB